MFYRFIVNLKGKARKDTLEGRPHMVVPVVMLVEGVIEGSEGAWFYSNEENAKSVPKWNHLPIVVNHPQEGGKHVSARQKSWLDSRKVGVILNTTHADGKLKAECWFDQERTKAVDKRVYEAVRKGKPMEVSTGLDATGVEKTGTFGSKAYKGLVKDYDPDHLAVLPDSVGACSIKMGGGLFANVSQEPESVASVLERSVLNALESIGVESINNELSFTDTSRQLSSLLGAKFGQKGRYWDGYVRDVFSDYAIFSDGSGKLYKIAYSVSESDGVSLSGSAVEVTVQVTYVAAGDGKKYLGNEGVLTEVPPEESTVAFDKNQHLTLLIGNGGYTEADRAWLSGMTDDQLQKVKPVNAAAAQTPAIPPPPPAPPPVPQQGQVVVTNEMIQAALARDPAYQQSQKALVQVRNAYATKIKADPLNKFTDDQLSKFDVDTLAAMAEMARDPNAVAQTTPTQYLNGWQPNYGGFAAPVYGSEQQVQITNAAPPEGTGPVRPRLFANKEEPESGKKTA